MLGVRLVTIVLILINLGPDPFHVEILVEFDTDAFVNHSEGQAPTHNRSQVTKSLSMVVFQTYEISIV